LPARSLSRRTGQNYWNGTGQNFRNPQEETLTYYKYPEPYWVRIRTNNAMERLLKEVRRRTRVVGAFPDGKSALMLATARVRWVSERRWSDRRYLDMHLIHDEAEAITA